MRLTWIVGLLDLNLIGQLISLTLEGQYLSSDTSSSFYALISFSFSQYTNVVSQIGGFFIVSWDIIRVLWDMFWWDYYFLTGPWVIFRLIGIACSIALAITIVMALRRGIIS